MGLFLHDDLIMFPLLSPWVSQNLQMLLLQIREDASLEEACPQGMNRSFGSVGASSVTEAVGLETRPDKERRERDRTFSGENNGTMARLLHGVYSLKTAIFWDDAAAS